MKAAVVHEFGGPLTIDAQFPDPACGPRDVILKVEACGVCRSDYTVWNGGFEWLGLVPGLPLVLGHEYAGIVEEAGAEVTKVRKGDRVVGPFGHACGVCECCADGRQNVCGAIRQDRARAGRRRDLVDEKLRHRRDVGHHCDVSAVPGPGLRQPVRTGGRTPA